jgi:hypothetical protein
LLDEARPVTADPFLRADIDQLRGMVELSVGVSIVAYRLLRRAAEEVAPHDPARALEILSFAGEAGSMASDAEAEVALGKLPPGSPWARGRASGSSLICSSASPTTSPATRPRPRSR